VVTSALHNSGERFDEPACHPGTRSAILSELLDWSLDVSPEGAPLLWLYGSAGAGNLRLHRNLLGSATRMADSVDPFSSSVDTHSGEPGTACSQP
jgi:hypothetical protein